MTTLQWSIPTRRTAGYRLWDRAWRVLGLPVMLLLASFIAWGSLEYWRLPQAWPLILLVSLAYSVSAAIVSRLSRFPKVEGFGVAILTTGLAFLVVIALVALGRFYYSRLFLLSSFAFATVWLVAGIYIFSRAADTRLGLIPGGMADELSEIDSVEWRWLNSPDLSDTEISNLDGVVVDLHQKLSPDWIRFLANCSLRGVPVYHAAVIFESLTGRVSLAHLTSGGDEVFRLPSLYPAIKRTLDVVVVLLSLPLVIPVVLVAAIVVKLGSPGPVFFLQERVGQGGEVFKIVKLRTMRVDADKRGAEFARANDDRIIPAGKWLRKFRIDELPQFWNVLKGEMSLIGPRPEQVPFARQFTREIPYYDYRHLVKPGITGWAQVVQGYAAGSDETREKLEYDLYYVKHLTVWLDLLIVYKTIRTILTGFGAR